jgi:hypothetical protein
MNDVVRLMTRNPVAAETIALLADCGINISSLFTSTGGVVKPDPAALENYLRLDEGPELACAR